jgi:hypothetical protein
MVVESNGDVVPDGVVVDPPPPLGVDDGEAKGLLPCALQHVQQTLAHLRTPSHPAALSELIEFEHTADNRQQTADSRQQTADSRQQTPKGRHQTADSR